MPRTDKQQAALDRLLERYADMMGRVWRKKLTASMRTAIISLALRYWNLRDQLQETGKYEPLSCVCKIDRIILTTKNLDLEMILGLEGYSASKKRRHLWKKSYNFCWSMKGTGSISKIDIEYEPTARWFPPFQITIIPKDSSGVLPEDLQRIFEVLPGATISVLEVAWDFPDDCRMDLEYVKRFGLFGKTWQSPSQKGKKKRKKEAGDSGNPFHIKRGSTSSKFVRAYLKWELSCFRIEMELHLALLRAKGIKNPSDFSKLAAILIPAHFKFAQLDEGRLLRSMRNRNLGPVAIRHIVAQVKREQRLSLWEALRYLTQGPAQLTNVQRDCLTGLDEPNRVIREAVEKLAAQWPTAPSRLGRKP